MMPVGRILPGLGSGHMAFLMLVSVMTGCFQQRHGPLDDDVLSLLTRAHFFQASLQDQLDPNCVRIVDERLAKDVLAALRPIRSAKVGKLPEDKVDYTFMFQSGKRPVVFDVHVSDGHLVYQERNYVYEGGDADSFMRAANTILDATSGGPPGR